MNKYVVRYRVAKNVLSLEYMKLKCVKSEREMKSVITNNEQGKGFFCHV